MPSFKLKSQDYGQLKNEKCLLSSKMFTQIIIKSIQILFDYFYTKMARKKKRNNVHLPKSWNDSLAMYIFEKKNKT